MDSYDDDDGNDEHDGQDDAYDGGSRHADGRASEARPGARRRPRLPLGALFLLRTSRFTELDVFWPPPKLSSVSSLAPQSNHLELN